MTEDRKKIIDIILLEAKKMIAEKTWPVTEEELVEHLGFRGSFEFGFVCGYLCNQQRIETVLEIK